MLGIDADKRLIAEIAASFSPARPLELGCASGAVMECLDQLGIAAEGVEISSMAIARAADAVRSRIHQGDLLSIDLTPGFDLVMAFDVFEHLNPNKLTAYLGRIVDVMAEGGFLLANIPAFGDDPVFGIVFPRYLDAWEQQSASGRLFSRIHCDELGYPIHGHLVWADATWWVTQFEDAGLTREVDVERALHKEYDAQMKRHAPARLSYFVFSKGDAAERKEEVIGTIRRRGTMAKRPVRAVS